METQRKVKLMWRWLIVTATVIALFWTIWYLATGSVPTVTSLKMTETWTINLGFGISRWWDILIGLIWSIIIILIFTSEKIQKDEDLGVGLVVGLAFIIKMVLMIFTMKFWSAIGNWLLASDAETQKT